MSTFLGLIEELPGISVDSFERNNLKSSAFFLSHCHTDHMNGLTPTFFESLKNHNKYLYCSPISKIILEHQFNFNENSYIKEIYLDTPTVIDYKDKDGNDHIISVVAISAGHCLGSVMFLFEGHGKVILYTGDFRINPDDLPMLRSLHVKQGNRLLPKKIDKIYLDTTFLSSDFSHLPSRAKCLMKIHQAIKQWLDKNPRNVVILECSALYGSEYLFIEISKSLNKKIHVKDEVYNVYCSIAELSPYITLNSNDTPIHACTEKPAKSLKCRDNVENENILIIIPSVFRWKGKDTSKVAEWDGVRTYCVCYSTHSSLNELKAFIQYFNPVDVFPCVCPRNQELEIYEMLNEIMNKSVDQAVANKPRYKLRVPKYKTQNVSPSKSIYFSDEDSS